jgi:hypothetical protein
LTHAAHRPVPPCQIIDGGGVEWCGPHERIESPQGRCPLEVPPQFEGCPDCGGHRDAVDGDDFVGTDPVGAHQQPGLPTPIVDENLDRFGVIDPAGSMQRGCGDAGDDSLSIGRQPGAEGSVGQRRSGVLRYVDPTEQRPVPPP